ncbi:hypothetical protein DRP77_01220 [Candidatus Poribacteria bacterium]|nr:MAG: hypothetical protein DRP77_01220 [Candidatus Poribacteria bacterium]
MASRAIAIIIALMAAQALVCEGGTFKLGLLAGGKELGEVAQAAYEWASQNYDALIIIPDGKGGFTDLNGRPHKLTEFAVLWLHYSQTNSLPAPFLTDETKKAILDYLQAGGTLFLTALGLHYTYDLGLVGVKPRVFSPLGKNPPEIGVVPTDEGKNHPIFAGFDTSKPIFLCSMAQDGFTSDFMNVPNIPGEILATKTRGGGPGAGERPLVEFDVGKGKIITLGHHNAVYTDEKSDEAQNLRKLTANIIEYLASHSAFSPVKPEGRLPAVWGAVKLR